MKKRGNVLRAPRGGPGLLMIEGRQFPFSVEGVWQSELAARPGLLVDVEFDSRSQITAIAAVTDSSPCNAMSQLIECVCQPRGISRLIAKLLGRRRVTAGRK